MTNDYMSETTHFPSLGAMIDHLCENCWEEDDIMGLLHRNRVDYTETDTAGDITIRTSYIYHWDYDNYEQDYWYNVQIITEYLGE